MKTKKTFHCFYIRSWHFIHYIDNVHDKLGEMRIDGKIVIAIKRILQTYWVIDDLLQMSSVT